MSVLVKFNKHFKVVADWISHVSVVSYFSGVNKLKKMKQKKKKRDRLWWVRNIF